MADERNTPFNQVFPNLVQLTAEGLLETGDGRPDPQQMLDEKASLSALGGMEDFYKEGFWTPTDESGGGLSLITPVQKNLYSKVGTLVIITYSITWPSTSDTNNTNIGGLPYPVNTDTSSGNIWGGGIGWASDPIPQSITFNSGSQTFRIRDSGYSHLANNDMSGIEIVGTLTYMTNRDS